MTSTTDLLRLLVVPFFAWAAYTDVQTRRIPNKVWGPLFVVGAALLAVSIQTAYADASGFALTRELVGIAVSLGVVAPVAYLFWLFGGFGGADAKALLVLSLILPAYPAYDVAGGLPVFQNPLGSFAFTILTNTVLVGVLFPATLFAKNALNGEFSLPMVLGERVSARAVADKYGTLMGTNDGMDSGSLDLDAVRMYLTWRDATLADVVENPNRLRDPASLPAERNDPGGGEIPTDDDADSDGTHHETDAAVAADGNDAAGDAGTDAGSDAAADEVRWDGNDSTDEGAGSNGDEAGSNGDVVGSNGDEADAAYDDPWGAEAFLDEIQGDAYGTTPAALRDGLDVLAAADEVWVSPGIPFIVPMFFGLLVSLTVGDLTTAALELL